MNPTWLEVVLTGFSAGIIGFVVKQAIANKIYVRKDFCQIQRNWLKETLQRIENKLDKLNGGNNQNG